MKMVKHVVAVLSFGLIFGTVGLASISSVADETKPMTIEVTSYQTMSRMQDASILAELCGFVRNQTGAVRVEMIIDANTHNPGNYHTSTGSTGNFCQLVRTFGGRAEVSILGTAVKASRAGLSSIR
jgi:hypothetical protein